MKNRKAVDKGKVIYFLITMVVSCLFSYFSQAFVAEKALDVLVNIYSIFAGFLIGVIALIGDPASMPSGSWRIAQASTRNTYRRLEGTKNLLYIYLTTLMLIFLYKLFSIDALIKLINQNSSIAQTKAVLESIKQYAEHLILFLASVAFSYSFKLPAVLFKIQKSRVEKEIERRRKESNIND